jgi:Rrf2 family transcriptional regulator, cysteine metabolism repressor
MNFTAKEDYGLRAVLDLAVYAGSGPVQTREIATRQRIPEQFLEQLLAALRRAEVVRSTRGAGGGYMLATSAGKITVGQVLRALSGPLVPTELVTGDADPSTREIPEAIIVRGVWESVREALRQVADRTTLQDLLDQRASNLREAAFMMNI